MLIKLVNGLVSNEESYPSNLKLGTKAELIIVNLTINHFRYSSFKEIFLLYKPINLSNLAKNSPIFFLFFYTRRKY